MIFSIITGKVNEMKAQRLSLYETIREAAIKDDITPQILAWGEKPLEELFKKELSKHDKNVAIIEQNLAAQPNILIALTDSYASCAPFIKTIVDTKHKREQFFSSLIASYDVYEDLLGKSTKGLEFYRKLQTNIQKLLARVRAARDVQDEERQQRIISSQNVVVMPKENVTPKPQGPKLRDYMKNGSLPLVRPSPVGSETITPVSCPSSNNQSNSLYYDSAAGTNQNYSGYTNPMYQSSQYYPQHPDPPPAYTYLPLHPQSTDPPPSYTPPVSQWDQTAIGNLSLQNQPNSQNPQDIQNYYSNAYASYQTDNKPYVQKYDQSVPATSITPSIQPQQQTPITSQNSNNLYSYNVHPGYAYSSSAGEYQYGSGYQIDPSTHQSQYTLAGNLTPTNTTMTDQTQNPQLTTSTHFNPHTTQMTSQFQTTIKTESVIQPPGSNETQLTNPVSGTFGIQQPVTSDANALNYYTYPYGGYNATDTYAAGIQQHQTIITPINSVNYPTSTYTDTNALLSPTTYMNSNNNVGTNTTNSSQFGEFNFNEFLL